jgi:hypothetical protein
MSSRTFLYRIRCSTTLSHTTFSYLLPFSQRFQNKIVLCDTENINTEYLKHGPLEFYQILTDYQEYTEELT